MAKFSNNLSTLEERGGLCSPTVSSLRFAPLSPNPPENLALLLCLFVDYIFVCALRSAAAAEFNFAQKRMGHSTFALIYYQRPYTACTYIWLLPVCGAWAPKSLYSVIFEFGNYSYCRADPGYRSLKYYLPDQRLCFSNINLIMCNLDFEETYLWLRLHSWLASWTEHHHHPRMRIFEVN